MSDPGPTRALAPDMARGAMLLLIALANVPAYLWGATYAGAVSHPVDGTTLDRVVQTVTIIAIDGRVYPMFTFLLGYGMWQFARVQDERGLSETQVGRILARRHLGLLALGAVHAALLFPGDILGAYGVLGLVMVVLFLRLRTRTLWIWVGIGVTGLIGFNLLVLLDPQPWGDGYLYAGFLRPYADPDYLATIVPRLQDWLLVTIAAPLFLSPMPVLVLLAWIAARARVLERPGEHLRLLWIVAVGGIAAGWLGGVPDALVHAGMLTRPSHMTAQDLVGEFSGFLCGLGYIAAFALLAHRLGSRAADHDMSQPWPVRVLVAVGRTSLTCYLVQSVVFAPLLSAWGVGLGDDLGSAGAAALAVATWAGSAVLATALARSGRRGPAEVVLRRITGTPSPARLPV